MGELNLQQNQETSNKEFRQKQFEAKLKKQAVKKQKELEKAKKKAEKAAKKKAEEAKKAKEADAAKKAGAEAKKAEEEEKNDVEDESEDEKDESEDEKDEDPPKVKLTDDEKKVWFKTSTVPDLSPFNLSMSFPKFCLPDSDEGFDEITYAWHKEKKAQEFLKSWILERKRTTRVEDITPSA